MVKFAINRHNNKYSYTGYVCALLTVLLTNRGIAYDMFVVQQGIGRSFVEKHRAVRQTGGKA